MIYNYDAFNVLAAKYKTHEGPIREVLNRFPESDYLCREGKNFVEQCQKAHRSIQLLPKLWRIYYEYTEIAFGPTSGLLVAMKGVKGTMEKLNERIQTEDGKTLVKSASEKFDLCVRDPRVEKLVKAGSGRADALSTLSGVEKFECVCTLIDHIRSKKFYTAFQLIQLQPVERVYNPWSHLLNDLVNALQKREVMPFEEDNPFILISYAHQFLEMFKEAPEEARNSIANGAISGWVRPVTLKSEWWHLHGMTIILLAGNFDALKTITPYLEEKDWLALGPENENYLHCVVAGLEKMGSFGGKTVECVHWIVARYPQLKGMETKGGKTPKQYLEEKVIPYLVRCLAGAKVCADVLSFSDCKGHGYGIRSSQYEAALRQAKELLHLL